jgi:ankyrin repeat protein
MFVAHFISATDDSHPGQDGTTPLMKAVREGKTNCVRVLLDLGADQSILDKVSDSNLQSPHSWVGWPYSIRYGVP